ncbi:MAG: Gmad2 immunoglobulin-like domain-containing protein [bacterium]
MDKKIKNIIYWAIFFLAIGFSCFLIFRGEEDGWFCQNGQWVKHGQPSAAMPVYNCLTYIVPVPKFIASISQNIQVLYPQPGQILPASAPLVIKGKARVFENNFNYSVKDGNGKELAGGYGTTNAKDIGLFGYFELKIEDIQPMTATGSVEVFDYSMKDGSVQDLVVIPIKFSK